MARIPEQRLARYRGLADRGLWDINNDAFRDFYNRASQEGVELISNNFNTLGMFRAPHRKALDDVDLAIVGIPLDLGVPNPRPGTRKGPEAVRYWSLDRNLVHYYTGICPYELCSVIDWGDVECSEDSFSLSACLDAIYRAYQPMVERDISTLSIGGEHTCTLIHLDAHADTSVGFGGTRISDASLFQVATVDGLIDPEKTIQIGIRGRGVPRCDFSYDSGMRVVLAEEFQEKTAAAIVEEALEIVGDGRVYLSIDTDVFDCMCMPGTTLPEPFGLTGREVRDIIRGLRELDIVGADLMELSPPYDPTGMSACLASGIAFELFCLLAEAKSRRNGKANPTHW
ncbi:MAG: arginase family protein [Deltaproteobacteria bacterium]|nr:arginase family protein [Deltaproteobacteria bacterium]